MQKKQHAQTVAGALLAFTIPLILSGLLQQMFNWVDAFIVGNIEGETALAGIGATTSLYNLFVTVITGFTSGLSVLSAQQYGMGEERKITGLLSFYAILLGALFAAVAAAGILFADKILLLLNTPAEIFADAESYLRLLLPGIPFLAVYNTYSAILRGIGNSRAPFLAVLVSSGVNIGLDLVFVAVLGFGAAGAAAATAISQAAMTVFIIVYAVRRYPALRFSFSRGALGRLPLKSGLWPDRRLCVHRKKLLPFHRRLLHRLWNQHGHQGLPGGHRRYGVLRHYRHPFPRRADRVFLRIPSGIRQYGGCIRGSLFLVLPAAAFFPAVCLETAEAGLGHTWLMGVPFDFYFPRFHAFCFSSTSANAFGSSCTRFSSPRMGHRSSFINTGISRACA